jgi:hypothetical protein
MDNGLATLLLHSEMATNRAEDESHSPFRKESVSVSHLMEVVGLLRNNTRV